MAAQIAAIIRSNGRAYNVSAEIVEATISQAVQTAATLNLSADEILEAVDEETRSYFRSL